MRQGILILILLAFSVSVAAQEIKIETDAPSSVPAGQRFRIVYSVNSTDGRFVAPAFDPSFTVSGPQTSTSRNVQWINGEVNSVSTTTLIYYVSASAPGHYTVPPAGYETKKATVSSTAIEIEVTDGQTTAQPGTTSSGQARPGGAEVSLRLILSTREIYVGQPVEATLKLFTRINLAGLNDLKYPDFKGFLKEDIETPPLRNLESEVIDGVQYGTGVIQKFILYPQVSGDITLDPVSLTAVVQQKSQGTDPFSNDPFFDSFFSSVTNVPLNIATQPAVLKVKPLPLPQPSDFHGAVGSFTLSAALSRNEIAVNDALTYTLTLKGKGNLSLAGEPLISFPQGIEKYDPKVNVKNSGASSGTKTYEYLLIPRNPGKYEIPPVSYTVFDPSSGKYVTLRAEGFTVNATGASGGEVAQSSPVSVSTDVKYLGQDIRYIRGGSGSLSRRSVPIVERSYYWLFFLVILALAVALLFLRREQARRNADVTGLRTRRAARMAKQRLSKAHSLMNGSNPEPVYDELASALWGYLGDKLAIPMSDLNRERCFSELRSRKTTEELIARLDLILTSTEYSRYSPSSERMSPGELYGKTAELIATLEDVLK